MAKLKCCFTKQKANSHPATGFFSVKYEIIGFPLLQTTLLPQSLSTFRVSLQLQNYHTWLRIKRFYLIFVM